jgi:hypothetical protein
LIGDFCVRLGRISFPVSSFYAVFRNRKSKI